MDLAIKILEYFENFQIADMLKEVKVYLTILFKNIQKQFGGNKED